MPNKYTDWIAAQRGKGYSDEEIRQYLAKNKVAQPDIDEGFKAGNDSIGPVSDFMAGFGGHFAHMADNAYQLLRKAAPSLPPNAVQDLFSPGTHYGEGTGGIDASVPNDVSAKLGGMAGGV